MSSSDQKDEKVNNLEIIFKNGKLDLIIGSKLKIQVTDKSS